MINYFRNRKNKDSARVLYKNVIDILASNLDFIKSDSAWVIESVIFTKGNDITYIHRLKGGLKYANEQRSFNEISGISIYARHKGDYIPLSVFVIGDVIQNIGLGFKSSISNEFDIHNLAFEELSLREIAIENPDYEKVSQILKDINPIKLKLFELEETFEIEMENKFLYTVVDMEDGNFLAIDKNKSVYRLMHDHAEPVKLVCKDIDEFLNRYDGNKFSIEDLFEYT